MLSIESPVALITVRPPVCMACLKIFDSEGDVFVVFSPRPVPGQNGLSVTFCNSVELIAHRLCNIMPIMDRGGTPGGNLNWQARLLSNCSSYIFVPRPSDDVDSALEESIMYSSLSLLTMQAEHADLQCQKQALVRRSQDLEKKVEDLRRRLQEEKDDNVRRHIEPHPTLRSVNKYTWLSDEGEDDHPSSAQQQDSKDSDSDDFAIPPDDDPNLKLVLELQRAFDDENLELTTQRDVLLKTSQRQYHCGICLDDFPEDDVVHIDTCEHKICRDCARGHVSAKINEHRFPVLCPVCTADPQNRHPGEISGFLVQLLGVSEEQYETWVEMEMAQFSVLINCRKCNQSAFVDRADAIASDNMRCPLPRCGHVWCKKCQQTIENNVEHSCDGSKEFENLVQQKQWKYCPSCRTPIEKQFGCNHLSCIVPGCNTHFCYGCGVTINRTAVPSEIMAGKTAHFRTCRLH
ncbi:hypothetical protein EDD15DRAFT_1809092 [Pisolithus albus]|nr:hypothetical protein EDD15DRAFT_1809092 [Pisolithus albus]